MLAASPALRAHPPATPSAPATRAWAGMEEVPAPSTCLFKRLDALGTFATLLSALEATGLAHGLRSGDAFTLFAPTDAAFRSLPDGALVSMSAEELTAVLRYHLVPGALRASRVPPRCAPVTVQGSALTVESFHGALLVNGTPVTSADVSAGNSVVHIIGAVLSPPPLARKPEGIRPGRLRPARRRDRRRV